MNRISRYYATFAVGSLNTLIFVLMLELLAAAAFAFGWLDDDTPPISPRSTQPYYQSQAWGATYWADHADLSDFQFLSYIGWRHTAYTSGTINISAEGIRQTPGADCDAEDAFVILALGGSGLWGFGAPDNMTIPYYVQQQLASELDRPVCMINYGEFAWVSSQNVLQVMLARRSGLQPDIVIAYDGFNDIEAGFLGHAGDVLEIEQIQRIFQDDSVTLGAWLQTTHLARALLQFTQPPEAVFAQDDRAQDINRIAAMMAFNYEQLAQWADVDGFELYTFLQPALLSDTTKPLTDLEQSILDEHLQRAVFHRSAADAILERSPSIVGLQGVFAQFTDDVYIDRVHLNPRGNQQVATVMVQTILAD